METSVHIRRDAAALTNQKTLKVHNPTKHTLTAIHHGWIELTPEHAEIEQTSTAGSEDVRFPVFLATDAWALAVLGTQFLKHCSLRATCRDAHIGRNGPLTHRNTLSMHVSSKDGERNHSMGSPMDGTPPQSKD